MDGLTLLPDNEDALGSCVWPTYRGAKPVTLILATVDKHGILVTADGLSVSTKLGHASARATLQKVFAGSTRPVAVAQCGKNYVDVHCQCGTHKKDSRKKNFEEWLSVFFYRSVLDDVVSIARSLRDSIELDDPGFFEDGDGSHLWVFGFSEGSNRPEFCRIGREGVRDLLQDNALPFKTCTGAGAQFLKNCEWQNHDEAFQYALENQGKRDKPDFGGRIHQLHVTPQACTWTSSHEPLRGTLGLEMTLGKWKANATDEEDLDNPRCRILSLRKILVDKLCARAVTPEGKHLKTYGGAKEHWHAVSRPNWELTDQLIAAHDDAELAHSADVSRDDAERYAALVQTIIDSLPGEVRPSR